MYLPHRTSPPLFFHGTRSEWQSRMSAIAARIVAVESPGWYGLPHRLAERLRPPMLAVPAPTSQHVP